MRACWGILACTALPLAAQDASPYATLPRAVFETELRAALFANADVLADALQATNPVATEMQEKVAEDLTLLTRLAPELLSGHDIALFTSPECESCQKAEKELRKLSEYYGTTFILHDLTAPGPARWAASLGLQTGPFYVLPDMILNGHMPKVALKKYLTPKAKVKE